MILRDLSHSYGAISRINHWLGAVAVITLLAVGLYFHEMPRGDEKAYWKGLHVSIGALSILFLAFRVYWRVVSRSPQPLVQTIAVQRAAKAIHGLLLVALSVLLVTGPMIVWTGDKSISIFGWFAIPSPLGKMELLHEALEKVHAVSSRVLLVTLILHVLGALKHAVLDRDHSLGRMFGRPAAE